jgi:hypothetical protein
MYVVDLAQGLGLLPISDELHDRLSTTDGDTMGFWLLPGGFGDVLGRLVTLRAGGLHRG